MRTRITAAGALVTVLAALSAGGSAGAAPRAAVPSPTLSDSLAFTHSRGDLLLIAAGVIVLLLLVLILRVTRRRRETAANATAQPRRLFPASADRWQNADLAQEATTPLPSFRPGEVVLPTAPPGWHPLQGDPTRLAYWDGTQWAAFRQWDGRQWVDAAPARD